MCKSVCVHWQTRKTPPELWKNFCMQKYHNFYILQKENQLDRRMNQRVERWIIDFLESTIRESGEGDKRELSLKFILIRSPFQFCNFPFFVQRQQFFLHERKMKTVSICTAKKASSVEERKEGMKRGDHSQCNALSGCLLGAYPHRHVTHTPVHTNNVFHSFINSFSLFLSPSLVSFL